MMLRPKRMIKTHKQVQVNSREMNHLLQSHPVAAGRTLTRYFWPLIFSFDVVT
jgi:hypothetical protein